MHDYVEELLEATLLDGEVDQDDYIDECADVQRRLSSVISSDVNPSDKPPSPTNFR